MEIKIEAILVEQKSVLIQLMELYNYDFSEFSDDDVNEYGYFGYSYIDAYWNDDDRFPYFIKVDGKIAGFILIRATCEYNKLLVPCYSVAEFFVMRKYRRHGAGKNAAMQVFNMHKGSWEVSQLPQNIPAQKFWQAVVNEYTGGEFNTFGSTEEGYVGFTFSNN